MESGAAFLARTTAPFYTDIRLDEGFHDAMRAAHSGFLGLHPDWDGWYDNASVLSHAVGDDVAGDEVDVTADAAIRTSVDVHLLLLCLDWWAWWLRLLHRVRIFKDVHNSLDSGSS